MLVNEGMLAHPRLAERNNVNFHIVNNGIGIEVPDFYPFEDLKLQSGQCCNIVAVGRLSPEKGFDVILKAIARVAEDGVDVSLVIFGEGFLRRRLEELVANLGLGTE